MWIPESSTPDDPNLVLAVQTAAEALGLAKGVEPILRNVYTAILEKYPEGPPAFVKVCTSRVDSEGIQISPVEAYHLNQLGMLGEELHRTDNNWGMHSNITRHYSWRLLNTTQLLVSISLAKP